MTTATVPEQQTGQDQPQPRFLTRWDLLQRAFDALQRAALNTGAGTAMTEVELGKAWMALAMFLPDPNQQPQVQPQAAPPA